MTSPARSFDAATADYDRYRPGYPDAMYDEIASVCGPLDRLRVLDLAAGTGLVTRALTGRGANVVASDVSEPMLRQLRAASTGAAAVAAAAEALPLRDGTVDLVTCATAWHWLDTDPTLAELDRVARPGGHLALFWANHRYDDDVDWEWAQQTVYARWGRRAGSFARSDRSAGPWEAADELRRRGRRVVVDRRFTWERAVSREDHLALLATHSMLLVLDEADRRALVAELAEALAPWPTVTERIHGPLLLVELGRP